MKRVLLGVMALVVFTAVGAFAKSYKFKSGNLQVNIPSDWEVENTSAKLSAYSPGDVALFFIEEFPDAADAEDEDAGKQLILDYITDDIGSDYEAGEAGFDTIGGMDIYYVDYTYDDESYGTAVCTSFVIMAGDTYSIVTIDVLEDGYDEYEAIMDEIVSSLKKIK
jgi:hypothetical protein